MAGFQKKYFWIGSEPVESKSLASYMRGEKPEIANHNVAWSSQTGKGLLYFSKFASEKATPAGIINLVSLPLDVLFQQLFNHAQQEMGLNFISISAIRIEVVQKEIKNI